MFVLVLSGVGGGGWRSNRLPSTAEPLHRPFDQILDLRARRLRVLPCAAHRAHRLDRYVASLKVTAGAYSDWSRDEDRVLAERL